MQEWPLNYLQLELLKLVLALVLELPLEQELDLGSDIKQLIVCEIMRVLTAASIF